MKPLLGIFLFLALLGDGLKEASRINQTVQRAETLYARGQYAQAAKLYKYLSDSLQVNDDQLILNQAHAAFQAGDEALAKRNYTRLSKNPDKALQSIATTQLGLIYFRNDNPERAQYNFKKALIQDPKNETARYNYELIIKYLAANPSMARPRDTKAPKPPQQNKSPQPSANNAPARPSREGQEGTIADDQAAGSNPATNRSEAAGPDNRGRSGGSDAPQPAPGTKAPQPTPQGQAGNQVKGRSNEAGQGNGPGSNNKEDAGAIENQEKQMQTLRTRLKGSDLSPEKATQLLEAIRNAELQYLQQVPRPPQKPRKDGTPDW